jgi:integrase
VRGKRERIASPQEAAALIAAVPEEERALWACAFYAGLRLGELQALRDEDVDLAAGVLHVRRSWDKIEGPVAPKSRAGVRKVPIVAILRAQIAAHRLRCRPGGLFFSDGETAFNDDTARARAAKAWKAAELARSVSTTHVTPTRPCRSPPASTRKPSRRTWGTHRSWSRSTATAT